MNRIAKTALGALMLAGTAVAVAAPASAGWSFGIGVGPGYYGPAYGPPAWAYCDPRSRYYDPYYCDDYDYYYGAPIFIDGIWFSGPLRSRWYGGHREFWVNNGWHYSSGYHGGGQFYHGGGGGGWHGGGGGGGWHGGGGGGWHGGGGGGSHGGHGGHH